MKVHELITMLQKHDPNMDVKICRDHVECDGACSASDHRCYCPTVSEFYSKFDVDKQLVNPRGRAVKEPFVLLTIDRWENTEIFN
jgi:hypothetical protein